MPSEIERVAHDSTPNPDRAPSEGRRDFLKGALAAGGAAASLAVTGLSSVTTADAQPGMVPGTTNHYYVPATDMFSRNSEAMKRGDLLAFLRQTSKLFQVNMSFFSKSASARHGVSRDLLRK